jgi:hypothetical protein
VLFRSEVEIARLLKRVLDSYGEIRYMSLNKETASLNNLIADLQNPVNSVYVESLGMTAWVAELKKENEQFQMAVNDRSSEYASRESGDTKSIRQKIDTLFTQMTDKINAFFTLNSASGAMDTFANELNEKIKSYQTSIAMRLSHKKKKAKA